jgi:hypothetical protein
MIALIAFSASAQTPTGADSEVIARISDATVLILSGEGAGRLTSTSTGVIVRSNGIILAAYHAIKDAKEVQIRLRTGEVYDRVFLIGVDERRDVAALKITASGLTVLPLEAAKKVAPGDAIFAVTNSEGLAWSASKGILSAVRMADEIPGAGQGFKLLQFTAPVSRGASGGPLVDENGVLIGMITRGVPSGVGFAVPIESIIGLADGSMNLALGSGSALQMASNNPTPSSAALITSDPNEIIRSAKTILVRSRTMYFTPETLERELVKQKDFASLGLLTVKDPRLADLWITLDRPLFTYTFTYSVTDSKTSIVLNTGKVTAIDGVAAAGKIAKQLVNTWKKIRIAEKPSEK